MTIRITGLNSGLDTEALISELVSAYNTKKQKYVKAQTKLSWKQSAWSSLNTKVKSLYSTLTSLRFSAAYSMKSSSISDSTKATITAGSSATNGVQSLQITQLAKSGYLTGGVLSTSTGGTVSTSSTLSSLGYSDGTGTITVKSGDTSTDVSVSGSTTVSDFISSLKSAGVNASFDATNQRIFVSASDTGEANDFTLTGSDSAGSSALYKLGLSVQSDTTTSEYTALSKFAVSAFDASTGTATAATTDSDGKLVYDETATQNYIKYLLQKGADTEDDNDTLTAANEAITGQLTYANNYEVSQSVVDTFVAAGGSADELKNIMSLDNKDTTFVNADGTSNGTVTDNGDYTYTWHYTNDAGEDATMNVSKDADGNYSYTNTSGDVVSLTTVSQRLEDLEIQAGLYTKDSDGNPVLDSDGNKTLNTTDAETFATAYTAARTYEDDTTNDATIISEIQAAHDSDSMQTYADGLQADYSTNAAAITANNTFLSSIEDIYSSSTDVSTESALNTATASALSKVENAVANLNGTAGTQYNSTATRVDGQDAVIYLNGAEFTSSSNTITVNDITVTATGVTGTEYDDTEASAVTITTSTDTQGLYDKIKDFLSQYNELINEMTSLYNADANKDYEPLTSDEKDAMTDTQIEEWEAKIKESLLRRDSTLGTLMTNMKNAMLKSYEGSDGKNYSLSSFGIQTLGYLNADEDEENAFHIYGDADDSYTSSNTDKLMAALQSDPDSVVDFMKNLTSGLYTSIGDQMKATSLRSSQTIYNDKEMAQEYSDYTDSISKWEDKVTDMEDYYYKKFAAMESALATLQSSSSALSSLLS